ncbi:hypothetical protein Tsubulata_003662 [Turnera subulata]|uniref:Aldehyde dehydrogenase domain-containing protein n=1 Tax=Turnera subulata TaxID=218843 RepID=A0A9Q0FWL7_9ROSI|nr:hypothetical protein Tsubulata_003662 [Turnera subulata]
MKATGNSNLKPVTLELGGKSPLLIFYDADVNTAAVLALSGALMNKVDKTQYDKILSYIEHGKREGATLVTGGTDNNGIEELIIRGLKFVNWGWNFEIG